MQDRLITVTGGVETSTTPTAGTPSDPSDLVPLSYFGTVVEQEAVGGTKDGVNTAFTVAHTPLSAWPFALFVDGVKQLLGTDYTRSGVNITISGGIASGQRLTADYRY